MTSPDGETWTARTAAEDNLWKSVAFGDGLFVAVAGDGGNRVMTSHDGTTWRATSPSAASWASVAYGGGRFVAVGDTGAFRTMTATSRWGPPTIDRATPGDAEALVSRNVPATGAASPITGYVVTPYAGTVAGTPRPFPAGPTVGLVTGLANGTKYTFKVAAVSDAGTGSASLASNAVTPVGTSRPFANWDLFVAQQLRDFTGNPGTAASRQPIVLKLATATLSPATFITNELNGAWFAPNVAPVARLYWAYFGRTPDYTGLLYWAGRRRAGTTLARISQSFASSQEFKTKYGALSNRSFVLRIYTDMLGRAADPTGLAYWTKRLDNGTSRGEVMTNFSESNEYKTKITPKVNVVLAFAGMLHRRPTAAELNTGSTLALTSLTDSIRLGAVYASRVT